jgi:hypothetical protein
MAMDALVGLVWYLFPLWVGRASIALLVFYAVMYVLFLNVEDE